MPLIPTSNHGGHPDRSAQRGVEGSSQPAAGKDPSTPLRSGRDDDGKKPGKGWPPARRAAQAARMRATKPWLRTAGPRTAAGKARAAQNARRHGLYAREGNLLRRALARQRRFVQAVRALLRARAAARRYPAFVRQVFAVAAGAFAPVKQAVKSGKTPLFRPGGSLYVW